jgi:4-amino-4-deoxy-L-arabinose transferase-like glycosyltransferase
MLLWSALGLSWCVGILGRGYWTPDEPREADISWRMSWQPQKAVPLLAGEPFCEKPPLTYWVAGSAIEALGGDAWAARLPNLLYALVTALAVGLIGRRAAGPIAGLTAAAAIGTFLLSYQAAIWLATDAPLLAAVAVSLWGLYTGFHALSSAERLRGYSCMHAAVAVGFMAKSAAAWMVPALAFVTLVVWERRWRELLRWELYVGFGLQAILILSWVWVVYAGTDGPARLKVFFWNNLVGRFARVDAPQELQYAAGHRNSPGKYILELPVYLFPWTLLVLAAARSALRRRRDALGPGVALERRGALTPGIALEPRDRPGPPDPLARRNLPRFAAAVFVPTVGVLSLAATARNVYLAPALPGAALLLGWWASDLETARDRWDLRALRGTAALLLLSVAVFAAALLIVAVDSGDAREPVSGYGTFSSVTLSHVTLSVAGLAIAAACSIASLWACGQGQMVRALFTLLLAYCALLTGPASQLYRSVDRWQDLASIGRAAERDAAGRPMILFAPDETTRAFVDLYARTSVDLIPGPFTPRSGDLLRTRLAAAPDSVVLTQLPGRNASPTLQAVEEWWGRHPRTPRPAVETEPTPEWAYRAGLRIVHRYALPNGRRYALLESPIDPSGAAPASPDATASR